MMQVTVLKEKATPEMMQVVDGLVPNDFVVVEGHVPPEVRSKSGAEILPTKIELVGKSLPTSPIDTEGHIESMLDKRLDWRALDLRNPSHFAIFRIQSKLLEGMQRYFYSRGFLEVFTPSLMGVSSEGGSEVFSLRHFGKTAYLRQDPQLHRQLLMLAGFEKIYEIGPSWRAELSHTPRHLTEHRTCACEMSFISDEYDIIRLEEGLVVSALRQVVDDCQSDLELLNVKLEVPKTPFPVLEFPGIYDVLKEVGVDVPCGQDYSREAEAALGKYVKEKYGSDFFFANKFPFAVKPFYVMKDEENPEWARSVDLVYKGIELSSGGQREHRYEKIIAQAKEKGLDPENLKWFTEFFRYGAPPHGGLSMGIERLTMQLLNLSNVREAALFPRSPERLVP
ncbi:Aspartate--tRNA(Asp) ligase [uncultured archaeon]|nr:Aspartate--tRNA(Asp) ligase [uncultured archaeon]